MREKLNLKTEESKKEGNERTKEIKERKNNT